MALIFALASPLLIAITGLTVDAGYWYQGQESLQSAADAAALATARAAVKASVTTTSGAQTFAAGNGLQIGLAAANNATNNQFQFTSTGQPGLTVSASAGTTSGTTSTIFWTATASMARGSFLSRVTGLGLKGIVPGTQSASATAVTVLTTGSYCMRTTGTITATGAAKIYGTNCGVYSGSTACASGAAAITVSGSGQVIGTTGVATASSCVSDDGYTTTPQYSQSGYIGTNANNSNNGNISTVSLNTSDPGDALAGMGSPPSSWPTMPTPPTLSAVTAPSFTNPTPRSTINLGWGTSGTGYSCPNGQSCTINQGSYTGNGSSSPTAMYVTSLTMNADSANGTTYLQGGFGAGSWGVPITLNGNNYYVLGGMGLEGAPITLNAGTTSTETMQIYGGATFNETSSTMTMPTGNYFFSGGSMGSSYATSTGLTYNSSGSGNLTVANQNSGQSFNVIGGANFGSGTVTLGQGTYNFVGPSASMAFKAASNWGFNASAGSGFSLTLSGSTASPSTLNVLGGLYYNGTVNLGQGTYDFVGGTTSCTASGTLASASLCGGNNSSFTTVGGTFYFTGPVGFSNGNVQFGPGTYEFYSNATPSAPTGWAMSVGVSSLTILGTTAYFSGGLDISNYSPTVTLGAGLYELSSYTNNTNASCTSGNGCSTGALYSYQGTWTFGAGSASTCPSSTTANTYFINGGLTLGGGAGNVTFCPGIYIIKNGNLLIGSGAKITATNVTFVLETGGFVIDGGATLNMSAPTTNCVSPTSYPESSGSTDYVDNSPYDGTNGEGICGIAIYQERGDRSADNIVEGGSSIISGAIYAPSAPLTLSGAGSLTITSSGIPTVTVASVSASGSGTLTMTENASSGSSSSGSVASSSVLLVN